MVEIILSDSAACGFFFFFPSTKRDFFWAGRYKEVILAEKKMVLVVNAQEAIEEIF